MEWLNNCIFQINAELELKNYISLFSGVKEASKFLIDRHIYQELVIRYDNVNSRRMGDW